MKIAPIHTVHPDVPLTTALSMLLEAGISSLPVMDSSGVLLDVYARGDITLLAKGNAYYRLQWEDLTVGQALSLAGMSQSQANLQAVNPATLHAQGACLQACVFYNIENVKEQHQIEAERQSIERISKHP